MHPHDNDVLSGRGNFVNYHPGNESFRALVKRHKVAYVACPKPQKGKFSKMIVDEVRALNPAGRFLKQDERTKLWYDIGDKKAMDKTRQALREGAPDIMRDISGEDEEYDDGDSPHSARSPTTVGSVSILYRSCFFVNWRKMQSFVLTSLSSTAATSRNLYASVASSAGAR